jgi:hypothetical protein
MILSKISDRENETADFGNENENDLPSFRGT